jgi:anti-anti-sigma regulatory factor
MVDNETHKTSVVLLELKGLEEVSLLVVKLTSVERMDSAFLVSILTACSLFRLQLHLPFE